MQKGYDLNFLAAKYFDPLVLGVELFGLFSQIFELIPLSFLLTSERTLYTFFRKSQNKNQDLVILWSWEP